MAAQTAVSQKEVVQKTELSRVVCAKIAIRAAIPAIIAVLAVQAIAVSIWPEIAGFRPLNSYARSALFTLIPAILATALFGRLYRTRPDPVAPFLKISAVVLLLSFLPDFLLPLAGRTLLASSVAALLHLTAAIFIVGGILLSYRTVTPEK